MTNTATRPIHYVSADALEALAFDCGYPIEMTAEYAAVVVREGTEFRAALGGAR